MQRHIRSELTEMAEVASIEVFAANLRKLLLTPPVRGKSVLAIDPGKGKFEAHILFSLPSTKLNYQIFGNFE